MFGLKSWIRRILLECLQEQRGVFRQYIGDDTVLIGGPGEMFLYLDGRDASLTPCLLRDPIWEPAIGHWMARNLREGDCFVDIGANIGFHALQATRHLGPAGFVAAFEPQERLYRLMERSVSANALLGQIHVRRLAIGAGEGWARLGKFPHLTGSATLTYNQLIVDHEEVEVLTLPTALDRISREIGRPCVPDAIKIDVEGFEGDVWAGMKEWTRERDRLAIVLEYSPVSYRDAGIDPLALLEDFNAYGFDVSILLADGDTRSLAHAEWVELAASRQQFDLVLTKSKAQEP